MTGKIEFEQIQAIVRAHDETLVPTGFEPLHGGVSDVHRIDLAEGKAPLVLKLYADEPSWAPAKEALVSGWIGARAGVPIPHWLVVDESRQHLPLRFALTTWLPGVTVRSLIGTPGIDDAYRQMGALLKRLHAIPMEAYGYVGADGVLRPQTSNEDYMRLAFGQVFKQFRELGGDEALARCLEEKVWPRFDLLCHSKGPALCHDDLQQGNVLAADDAKGRLSLTGLLDFGNARAADPLFDLAKTLFCCTHEDPSSRETLLAGYGEIDHPDVDGALRLYTLFHRLSMWGWLTRQGHALEGPAEFLRSLEASC